MKTKIMFYQIKTEAYYDECFTKRCVLLREGELLEPTAWGLPEITGITATGRKVVLSHEDYEEIALDDDLVIRRDTVWNVDRAFA
jgi:hypothetical protein